MRLNPILLAAAAALLVSCNTAAAATELKQTQLPKVTAADAVQSVDSFSGKLTRFLRGVKTVEEEKDESEEDSEEERGIQLKTVDDILADLEAAESKMLVHLSSYDRDILTRIENTSGAKDRIARWKENELSPLDVASILNGYPSLSRTGAEWTAWKLYAAQYLRIHGSVGILSLSPKLDRFAQQCVHAVVTYHW